ncbi:GntP family permease [Eubacteriaceae bacterium ES2]|nr:GntP family permease [Eubacteriaceae bacterium ES2]
MAGLSLMIAFLVAIIVIIVSISKWNLHPFLALMGVSLCLAIASGIEISEIPSLIGSGFSGVFSSIGIVIILGALIGAILEKTGAAIVITQAILKVVGPKKPRLALLIVGWIISIPVFCDSGFVILNPIRKNLARKTTASSAELTLALGTGLLISHVLIPPTPGPIAAAGALGIGNDLFTMIMMGTLVSLPTLLVAYVWSRKIGRGMISCEEENAVEQEQEYAGILDHPCGGISVLSALLPIILPIFLMAMGTFVGLLNSPQTFKDWISFLGAPMIALTIGLLFAIALLFKQKCASSLHELTSQTLSLVGPILFITAAGGVLGKVIVAAGLVDWIQLHAQGFVGMGLFFPFLMAALLKTAQGSSTVAITTVASMMGAYSDPASLMSALGFTNPMAATLVALSVGAGSMIVSHANDSYFWVITQLGGLTPAQGYRSYSLMTFILGCTAMASVFILSLFLI